MVPLVTMDNRDPFKDLTFDGRPGQYREFRRKVILAVAALEDKNQYLAGAKLLGRLTGEAWRCTEHLQVAQVRSPKGWLIVLDCLDRNYKHLPEVELHEAIDDFLFHLKRKPNEGTTGFSARFKTALARLENLIQQEREMSKAKKRKKDHESRPGPPSPDDSSLDDSSSDTEKKEEADQTDENEEQADPKPQEEEQRGPFDPPLSRSGGSERASSAKSSKKHSSAGSWKADQKRSQLDMQRMLGALEPSHRRPRPIFPQSVLGHLFMRKFGLNREQRSLVIRSTGGSSRYQDVERILRASDLEDQRPDERRHQKLQLKPQRRETFAVQEDPNDSSSLEVPMSESEESAEVMLGEGQDDEEESNYELEEVYEIQKKAKRDFKKSFKTYKESKRRVKEIKKTRAGPSTYYPVVAVPPESGSAGSSGAQQGTRPFNKDPGRGKKGDGRSGKSTARKEEVNMTQTSVMEEFSYMVTADGGELEVFLASIPQGYAIIDTGCTTSVIGERTAQELSSFLQSRGYPLPQQVVLPAVELKGFNGKVEKATQGLKWTVRLGSLQGNITTYIIPGVTPFLLSRRVLEAMEAILDLRHHTITSVKHDMHQMPLRQASNGHLLMPLCPIENDLEIAQCSLQPCPMHSISQDKHSCVDDVGKETPKEDNLSMVVNPSVSPSDLVDNDKPPKSNPKKVSKTSPLDKKRAFQTIVKNTKNGIVDVDQFRDQLGVVYPEGFSIEYAATAYKPKKERVPKDGNRVTYECSVASLSHDGTFNVSPWRIRNPSEERRPVSPMNVAIFAFRRSEPNDTASCVQSCEDQPTCYCCSDKDSIEPLKEDSNISVETLYEEIDWIDVDNQKPLPKEIAKSLSKGLSSLRNASNRLILSRLGEHRSEVRAELQTWLGDQQHLLDKKVGLIEVFTGKANLSTVFEQRTGLHAIRLGLDYGQDFTRVHDRRCLLLLIAYCRPKHLWFSFPCKYWSPWTHVNMSKNQSTHDEIAKQREIAKRYLHNVSEAWNLQHQLGGHAYAENPLSSQAWAELSLGSSWEVRVDQCALGLRSPKSDLPVLKPTRIVTTRPDFASELVTCRCDGKHQHEHLAGTFKGKNLTSWAETYPRKFCRTMVDLMKRFDSSKVRPTIQEVLAEDDDEQLEEDNPEDLGIVPELEGGELSENRINRIELSKAKALVRKVHVNTGHSSKEQLMRLAVRCKSSNAIKQAIRDFKCSVCEEMKLPPSHRVAAMPHSDQPNTVVGLDFVQVELKRENKDGKVIEIKRNVLTAVDLATDFCQQIVVPPGQYGLSGAFHDVWGRPYGVPKVIFMDPDHRNISIDFQRYLARNGIQLLHTAADSHWQLGKVEVCNRILRGMAQRVWKEAIDATPEEEIESCAMIRNEQLRKHGFSPVQWFLGREPKHAGALTDVDEQMNPATQSQVLDDPSMARKLYLREQAAHAFIEEHAKDVWRRAVGGRNRPMRGPYTQGQLVYVFRKQGRGRLSTRHGVWLGPGRIIGTESSSQSKIPRLIWVSLNGFLYRCSPEGLRPLPEDEAAFRKLTRELSVGKLSDDAEMAGENLDKRWGQYIDLVPDTPEDMDFDLKDDLKEDNEEGDEKLEGGPRKVRRAFYRTPQYWRDKAAGRQQPLGALHEGPAPEVITEFPTPRTRSPRDNQRDDGDKRRRVEINSDAERIEFDPNRPDYSPSIAPSVQPEMPDNSPLMDEPMPDAADSNDQQNPADMEVENSEPQQVEPSAPSQGDQPLEPVDVPVPSDDELIVSQNTMRSEQIFELSVDVCPEDITENPLCLWNVLEECFEITPKTKQRRVEVSFRKLSPADKKLFEGAMKKEWNSWIENKVTSLCKTRGVPIDRIIKARWVLVWKKSSDPDDKTKTPKARLVLVGWQDPELGKIQTDSPTLRKETKHMILSICASMRWKIWGADIKTAFLSGDPSQRDIYFRPPPEIKEWMQLSQDDLFRLEKAAYGLAEAPRAWFLRLSREMSSVGLSVSQLDPCLYTLKKNKKLVGVCGVHVDDIIGGGTKEMDEVLEKLKGKLPFGDYRTYTIRYTGIEIRQNPVTRAIEIGQENYIEALETVPTKQYGNASTALKDPSIMRTCAGQLAWVANSTRPDQAFLASYLQGIQDKGTVAHLQLYIKALREMKERKVCLCFPAGIPIEDWRIICIADAGWATRANGDSQAGYLLCMSTPSILQRKRSPCWIIDWQSKKLRRVVRSSVAAETLSSQNGLDGLVAYQALLAETLENITPREFRDAKPKNPSALIIDSKGFFDAVTRSCCSQAVSQERRLQIEYSIAKETTESQNIIVFWVNNLRMSADCLTKLKGDTKPLFEILEGGSYEITICNQSGRKEKQAMKDSH